MIRLSFFAWFFPVLVPQNQIAFFFNFGYLLSITADSFLNNHEMCSLDPTNGQYMACGMIYRGNDIDLGGIYEAIRSVRNKFKIPFVPWHSIESVPTHHQGRPVTVRPFGRCFAPKCLCLFFCKGRLITSDRPSGGPSDPSVCPTGGDLAPVLGGGLCCIRRFFYFESQLLFVFL